MNWPLFSLKDKLNPTITGRMWHKVNFNAEMEFSLASPRSVTIVEKGKISYFGLARNLIRHLISPNQDDLSYSPRTFISGHQIL